MNFQVHALDPALFARLYGLDDLSLEAHRAQWVKVDAMPGYPCRVSLEDAPVGSKVLLVNFSHQPHNSPYRASHAIYVRPGASRAFPRPNTVPDALASRLISWRAFDREHRLVDANVAQGRGLSAILPEVLSSGTVAYVDLHNAGPGCFAARATRATDRPSQA